METIYGIISDVHSRPDSVPAAISALKNLGAQKLIVNGDIGISGDMYDSWEYTSNILEAIGKSNLPAYVQPGSHETYFGYSPIVKAAAAAFPNIISTLEENVFNEDGHSLFFIPGSDSHAGGEFSFGNQAKTGLYMNTEYNTIPCTDETFFILLKKGIAKSVSYYTNIEDSASRITNPEKTIAVCHVPRKFENIDTCVDYAYFAQGKDGRIIPGKILEEAAKEKFQNPTPEQIVEFALENGFELKRENRGNELLKLLYENLGITKALSAHFHESAGRANNLSGGHVDEEAYSAELFWNSGCIEDGTFGILAVSDDMVKYRNLDLKDFERY